MDHGSRVAARGPRRGKPGRRRPVKAKPGKLLLGFLGLFILMLVASYMSSKVKGGTSATAPAEETLSQRAGSEASAGSGGSSQAVGDTVHGEGVADATAASEASDTLSSS